MNRRPDRSLTASPTRYTTADVLRQQHALAALEAQRKRQARQALLMRLLAAAIGLGIAAALFRSF